MNKVILMGRLTKDPAVSSYTKQDGTAGTTARFTLAVDRRGKDAGADFIGIIAFNKIGEFAARYLKKGTKIVIDGRIQTGSYEKDGARIYTTDVIADNIEFAESKAAETATTTAPAAAPQTATDSDGFMTINEAMSEDGLPFN